MKMRKFVTKTRDGHFTATVRIQGKPGPALWKSGNLSSAHEANRQANDFIAAANAQSPDEEAQRADTGSPQERGQPDTEGEAA